MILTEGGIVSLYKGLLYVKFGNKVIIVLLSKLNFLSWLEDPLIPYTD